jgi:enterochelin esterase-like enzyme
MTRTVKAALAIAALAATAQPAAAQAGAQRPPAVAEAGSFTIERIKVRAPSIAGNLEGNAADRDVLVVLPPSYRTHPERRYPVVYTLHGYTLSAEDWRGYLNLPHTAQAALAQGGREMILVLPDSKTVHNGSMYSRSETTGDFETFIARDLVAYMDGHYRTLVRRESRGLAGHSMGGYGTSRIGMKYPDMFSALYIMSPCCLSVRTLAPVDAAGMKMLEALKSPADSAGLSFGQRAQLATASAWSPNPANPPLYLDLPVKEGVAQPNVLAKWAANAPLAFVDQYAGNLRRYKAIAIDVGDKDGLKEYAQILHDLLDRYHIANSFEIYEGDHGNRVTQRFQDKVIPFFSQHLDFGTAK